MDRLIEWGGDLLHAAGPLLGGLAVVGIGLYCLLTLTGGND